MAFSLWFVPRYYKQDSFKLLVRASRVEARSSASTVALRVVVGHEGGSLES
jgi:hypothetical protein